MPQRDVFNGEMRSFDRKMTVKRRQKEGNAKGYFFWIWILLILEFNRIMAGRTRYNPIKS